METPYEIGQSVIVTRRNPNRNRPAKIVALRPTKAVVRWSIPDHDTAPETSVVPISQVQPFTDKPRRQRERL